VAAPLNPSKGEFNGGCTAANGCREQSLLAVILREGIDSAQWSAKPVR